MCIGELKEERESGETFNVCDVQVCSRSPALPCFKSLIMVVLRRFSQLTEGLKGVSAEMMKDIVIAYEPVWAIGTGLTATPEVSYQSRPIWTLYDLLT